MKMFELGFGMLALLVAIVAFVFYLWTSYETHGGSLGQDPCIAAATIQVPLMTMLGLALLGNAGQFDFAWWVYVLIWFVETLCVAATAVGIGRLGERKAKGPHAA
jgi:hypothetical protein